MQIFKLNFICIGLFITFHSCSPTKKINQDSICEIVIPITDHLSSDTLFYSNWSEKTIFKIPSNLSTGYSWEIGNYKNLKIEELPYEYLSDSLGVTGYNVFLITDIKKNNISNFCYKRHFEKTNEFIKSLILN